MLDSDIKTHGHESAAAKPCVTQVSNLQELLTRHFQPFVSLYPLDRFQSNLPILCPPYYTQLYMPNLKNRPSIS